MKSVNTLSTNIEMDLHSTKNRKIRSVSCVVVVPGLALVAAIATTWMQFHWLLTILAWWFAGSLILAMIIGRAIRRNQSPSPPNLQRRRATQPVYSNDSPDASQPVQTREQTPR